MTRLHLALIVLAAAVAAACGSVVQTPVTPTATVATDASAGSPVPSALPGPCTIGFEGLQVNGASFTRYSACGVTLTASVAPWQALTTYGAPAPFIQFQAAAGTTIAGDLVVRSDDGAFVFTSVDIYSSTTKIPYVITGASRGALVFRLEAVQGNTFGRFATVINPHTDTPIDTLRVSLTNPAAPCCTNPMGLDNIRIAR